MQHLLVEANFFMTSFVNIYVRIDIFVISVERFVDLSEIFCVEVGMSSLNLLPVVVSYQLPRDLLMLITW